MKNLVYAAICVCAFISNKAYPTHIMGSDIRWKCLGGDSFEITVSVFRDCNGTNLQPSVIKIESTCGSRDLVTTMSGGLDVTPLCRASCSRCDSSRCSFPYGIQAYELTAVTNLSDWRINGCCIVTISWTQCCRNRSITTGGASQNFYIDATLNICQSPCDNSPVFTGSPISFICLGRDVIINQGVQDYDTNAIMGGLSDSLVYSWTEPLLTPSTPMKWTSGYAYNKPIYYLGFPKTGMAFPRDIHLDSATGDLMFRPMKIDITVMAIKVESYRNKVLTAVVKRDVQVNVLKCPDNNPPVVSGVNCKEPKPANFQALACAGQPICFTVCTSDKDRTDTVTLEWNQAIEGASFTIINKGNIHETGRFCWTPSVSDVSNYPYSFMVTAKDNACPVNGLASRAFSIKVRESPKATYDTLIHDCGWVDFSAKSIGQVKVIQYYWVFEGDATVGPGGNAHTTKHKFKQPGKQPFKFYAVGKHCNSTHLDTVSVPTFAHINVDTDSLNRFPGDTVVAKAVVNDAAHNYRVTWSTGQTFTNTGGQVTLVLGDEDSIVYVAATVDDGYCVSSDTIAIKVELPVGTEQTASNPGFELWPNPSRGVFWLRPQACRPGVRAVAEVFSLDGKRLYYKEFDDEFPASLPLDLGHLNSGMYRLQVREGDSLYQIGLIIQ